MSGQNQSGDKIRINDLALSVFLQGGSSWESKEHELQPIRISLAISSDISKVVETGHYDSLQTLSNTIFDFAFHTRTNISELDVEIVQTKAPLHAKLVGFVCSRARDDGKTLERYFISDLICSAIVGANACERNDKQDVCVNLSVERPHGRTPERPFDYRGLIRMIYDVRQCPL
jgi:dihydroneopterin aldolase / 2-amino-4-hydroxy-6-hydroxymethyldihydropteridine diphosphokinase / dihydropteroate synthase